MKPSARGDMLLGHSRRTPRQLLAAMVLVVVVGAGCSPDAVPLADVPSTTSTEATPRLRSADEPCVNGRADERGASTPADDTYVDDEVLEWPLATPGEEGFNATALESVVDDVGQSSTVLSLLVARRGELVVEEYFNGGEAAHAHNIFSTTKLLTVLAIGAAADDGIVPGLDTSLGEWVEETAGRPAAQITLEQLLSMRSGLATEGNEPFSAEVVADPRPETEPGSTYAYVTDNSELLALGLDRRVPGGLCRYVHDQVLGPMGVSVDHWHETPYGNVTGGSYAFLTPRELARLGQLLLNEGRWADEQLVPATWIVRNSRDGSPSSRISAPMLSRPSLMPKCCSEYSQRTGSWSISVSPGAAPGPNGPRRVRTPGSRALERRSMIACEPGAPGRGRRQA